MVWLLQIDQAMGRAMGWAMVKISAIFLVVISSLSAQASAVISCAATLTGELQLAEAQQLIQSHPELAVALLQEKRYGKKLAARMVVREPTVSAYVISSAKYAAPDVDIVSNVRPFNPILDQKTATGKRLVTLYRGVNLDYLRLQDRSAPRDGSILRLLKGDDFSGQGDLWVTTNFAHAKGYAVGPDKSGSYATRTGFVLKMRVPEFLVNWKTDKDERELDYNEAYVYLHDIIEDHRNFIVSATQVWDEEVRDNPSDDPFYVEYYDDDYGDYYPSNGSDDNTRLVPSSREVSVQMAPLFDFWFRPQSVQPRNRR